MGMIYIVLFLGCVFCSSCSQILLKHSAKKEYTGIRVYLNLETISGYMIMLLMTFGVAILYRHIDLSLGAMLDSMGYVFVIGLSAVFLKERINKEQVIGMLLIIAGTVVYCLP